MLGLAGAAAFAVGRRVADHNEPRISQLRQGPGNGVGPGQRGPKQRDRQLVPPQGGMGGMGGNGRGLGSVLGGAAALGNVEHGEFTVTGADGKATVVREVDAGLETLEVDLPAVVTTDLRLNEPRFIKLPDIMKAKSKPLETIAFADLGVEANQGLKTTHYAPPAQRSRGVMVKDAAELVAALKQKGLL